MWQRVNKLAVLLCLVSTLGCGSGGGGEADVGPDSAVADLGADLGAPDVPPADLGQDLVELPDTVELVPTLDVVEIADHAELDTACPAGYGGEDCSEPICSAPCQNGGTCVAPDICECGECWKGATCTECAEDCACAGCGQACVDGECVFAACEGKVCGDDGCGGSCGQCDDHYACEAGACVFQPWCGDGNCDSGVAEDCETCPQDCGCTVCGESCVLGMCQFAACEGRVCGDDGCGGSCGQCGLGEECGASGQCKEVTWLDDTTGLMWQVEPDGAYTWNDAVTHCEDLTLGGYSDWHMPDSKQLRSLVRGCPATQVGGSCDAGELCQKPFMCFMGECECWNDTCLGCTANGGPAEGCYWPEQLEGPCVWYWSTFQSLLSASWLTVEFGAADARFAGDEFSGPVRCVRAQFDCDPGCNVGGFCTGSNSCTCEPNWAGLLCNECVTDWACKTCGDVCIAGQCTFTACDGKQCGDDGCGGSCGQCDKGSKCDSSGICVVETYADPISGLYWELNPSSKTYWNFNDASVYCNTLTLGGLSDWHLPSLDQLRSLLQGCPGLDLNGGCGIGDACASWDCWTSACSPCSDGGGPDEGCYRPESISGVCGPVWSGTHESSAVVYWYLDFRTGYMDLVLNGVEPTVICVHE